MRKTRSRIGRISALVLLLAFAVWGGAAGALGDGLMPMMPEPPQTPVYWQLVRIEQEPTVQQSAGYAVRFDPVGLSLDLSDGLMAESNLEKDGSYVSGIDFTLDKNGTVLSQQYRWTPLPIYLEPGKAYPIEITGTEQTGSKTLNSLLRSYLQGEEVTRISAGGYTGHPTAATLTVDPSNTALYNDGGIAVSFILREVNGMLRLRVVYTYEMRGGEKPEPTPFPGFLAVAPEAGVVPSYYEAVPGKDGLWVVTTAPDQYRAYGLMTGVGPNFFPADADGNVAMDESPVDPAADYANYVQGFVPVTAAETPAQYRIQSPGVYAFTDRDGGTVTRAYGRMNGGPAAFYPADEAGNVEVDARPVTPEADFDAYVKGFGHAAPEALPPHYRVIGDNVYGFTGRDGETRYRVFGRLDGAEPAFYPSDAAGTPTEGAEPVLPEDDFESYIKGFDAKQPDSVPTYYKVVGDGLYTVDDRDGNPVYRAYGVLDGQAPAFYPAGADGSVADGAVPVDPQADFDAYVKGFAPVAQADGDAPMFYEKSETPGVWQFDDMNGQTQYRVYGSMDRGEPAYYPSDAAGNVAEGAMPVVPDADLVTMPPPSLKAAEAPEAPAHYQPVEGKPGVYSFVDRDGNTQYRVYGAYGREEARFYPSDADGAPLPDAAPVRPEDDFANLIKGFRPTEPESVPAFYGVISDGLYGFDGPEGERVLRVHGVLDGQAPAFYPADADGGIAEGAAPADLNADYEAYQKGFARQSPAAEIVPPHYTIVEGTEGLYQFEDRDGNKVYRVYGAFGGVTGFYPSDENGQPLDGAPLNTGDDVALLPTPMAWQVATPVPGAQTEAVQVLREYTPEPKSTSYTGSVSAAATAGGDARTVSSVITPEPAATTYAGAVSPGTTATAGAAQVAQNQTAIPDATAYTGAVSPAPDATATEVAQVTQNQTAVPDATAYTGAVSAAPDATATGAAQVAQNQTAAPEETAVTVVAQPDQTSSAPDVSATPEASGTPGDAPSVTPGTAESVSPEQTAGADGKTSGGGFPWLYVLIAAGVAGVGGGAWALTAKRKKK